MKANEPVNASAPEISFADFLKVDIRVGQVIEVRDNPKSRLPAYVLKIDFGELGHKISSAQITENYSQEELIGKQVVAVVNFPPKRVAGVKSEVLVIAAVCQNSGTVLVQPSLMVQNGTSVA